MEWLLPENDGAILRPTTGSPIRSSREGRRATSTSRGVWKKESLPCSMILLEAAADAVRSSTCLQRKPLTSRGGVKRPRTTSSMTSSMASSMLSTTPALTMTKIEAWHKRERKGDKVKPQQSLLVRSRGARPPGDLEQHPPSVSSSIIHTEHAIHGSAAAANKRDCVVDSSYSTAFDGADEAEAIAADEAVLSLPPSPPSTRVLRASTPGPSTSPPSVDKQQLEATRTTRNSLNVGPCCTASSAVCGSMPGHHLVGENFIFQPNKSDAAVAVGDTIGSKKEDGPNVVPMESEGCPPNEDTSSRGLDVALCETERDNKQMGERIQRSSHGVVTSGRHRQPLLGGSARKLFWATMSRSDDACQSVREDLVRYMEGVRANVGEDGTPCVTFPRNFDRVVGLMGRRELGESPQLEREEMSKNGANGGGGKARQGKTQDAPPPWTKYLLDDGLDRTKTFSRYRGLFADEHTGEDRVMHGLAKMRELDLRLARTTQRARELRKMARDAAEEAERAAGMDLTQNFEPLPDHPRGRSPVAIDDTLGTVPVVTVTMQRLTSNNLGSGGSDEQPDPDAPLATPRSERSAASGSRCGGIGGGRGKAFLTQTFRGPGRGPDFLSGTATSSASNSVASSVCSHRGAGTVGRRRKGSGSGGSGGLVSARGGGGASSGGGSSGVSFVSKNKRHAAKARRRLTDEQESLVARFLGDADGYNEDGQLTGDPSGIWAEITPYGGSEAHEDTARLTEIDAQLLALGGAVPIVDSSSTDDGSANAKNCDSTTVSGGLLKQGNTLHSDNQAMPEQNAVGANQVPSLSRDARNTTTPRNPSTGDIVPGEGTLREQRESRQIRNRERAIDIALEQLRDSLFADSAANLGSRETAVDAALEQARQAPLSLQTGIRQGAGRVDSLLGGEGPQPVGEWEVKHALRQSEEELRGKDLVSCERIAELSTLVRRDATANTHDNGGTEDSGREGEGFDNGDLFQDTNLDAFFVLGDRGAAKSPPDQRSIRPRYVRNTPVSVNEMPPSMQVNTASFDDGLRREGMAPGVGSLSERETAVDEPEGRHGEHLSVATTKDARGRRQGRAPEEEQETPSNSVHNGSVSSNTPATTETETTSSSAVSTSTSLAVESDTSRQRHRRTTTNATSKRLSAADAAAAGVAPEIAALFRVPLFVPRVDPPIAGIAAAAIASGGGSNSRRKRKPSLAATSVLAGRLRLRFP